MPGKGLALGGAGEIADELATYDHDLSNHDGPSRQADRRRQGITDNPGTPGLVCYTAGHDENDHTLFGNGSGARVQSGQRR